MKPEKPPFSPSEYLDQRQQTLTQKHQGDLHRITQNALQSRHNKWSGNWAKPALATAFSIMLVTTIVLLRPTEEQPESLNQLAEHSTLLPTTLPSTLPEWLADTDVPLTLIESFEFYDWLAHQPEDEQAVFQQRMDQKDIAMVINEFYQYRFGKRLTSSNPTQRFSGTASYTGSYQREGI